jgi:putative transposase
MKYWQPLILIFQKLRGALVCTVVRCHASWKSNRLSNIWVSCASLTPHQIVPKLADEGTYLASESTFYRILKAAGLGQRRGRSKAPVARPLTTHRADGPNQVWCWDITWLPSTVKGRYFYWYMVKDIYSRKLVVNEVHESESSAYACQLLRRGCLREQTAGRPLVLHSDNGSVMKAATLLATMQELGVAPSYSRPRVSNDITTTPMRRRCFAPPSTAPCGLTGRSTH